MQGCVYISGLSMDNRCVRALMNYARVLLISTPALPGRQFVQGLNALGVPLVSSRMLRAALLGVILLCDAARLFSRRPLHRCLALGGLSIRLIMGQHGPDDPGIFVS